MHGVIKRIFSLSSKSLVAETYEEMEVDELYEDKNGNEDVEALLFLCPFSKPSLIDIGSAIFTSVLTLYVLILIV